MDGTIHGLARAAVFGITSVLPVLMNSSAKRHAWSSSRPGYSANLAQDASFLLLEALYTFDHILRCGGSKAVNENVARFFVNHIVRHKRRRIDLLRVISISVSLSEPAAFDRYDDLRAKRTF